MASVRYALIPKGFPTAPIVWHYVCDTEAELPTVNEGSTAYTKDSAKQWKRISNGWAESAPAGAGGGPHTHPIGEVVGLQAALDAKQNAVYQVAVQSANVSTGANINPVSVPGCSFSFVANGIYMIDFVGLTSAALTTTGHGFQLDTSVAVTVNSLTFYHQLANAGTVTGGSAIADDASVGLSSGRPTASVVVPHHGAGSLFAGAQGGTAQLRFRSEVAAVATCSGCVLRVMRVA